MKNIVSILVIILLLTACKEPKSHIIIRNNNSIENTSSEDIITVTLEYSCDSTETKKTSVFKKLEPGEIRKLDSLCATRKGVVVKSAYLEEVKENQLIKYVLSILLAIIGVGGSLYLFVFQRGIKGKHEIKIVRREIKDAIRHLERNKIWIARVKETNFNGEPLIFYLERLLFWDKMLLKTEETYRTVHERYVQALAHARLHIRNSDIEVNNFIELLKSGTYEQETLIQYWDFIKDKNSFLIEWFTITEKFLGTKHSWWKDDALTAYQNKIKEVNESNPAKVIVRKEKIDLLKKYIEVDRDHPVVHLENFIIMPPSSSTKERGNNILHVNTKNSYYKDNESSKKLIDEIRITNKSLKGFTSDAETLKYAVEKARELNPDGIFLEFGFCTGASINFIAGLVPVNSVFGFDSIQGLDNNWRTNFDKGVFSYKNPNRFPFIPLSNIKLIIGWLKDTLPEFKDHYPSELKELAFINIDTDTKDAAELILTELAEFIIPEKTIIYLDEGFNFKDGDEKPEEWKKHEFLAINEFASKKGFDIEYLAFNENHQQLVLRFMNKKASTNS